MSSSLTPGGSLTKEGRDKALDLLAAATFNLTSEELRADIETFLAEVDARPDA